ncbi:MAG: COX15/CtaA family protein [Actinomycetota bacterium]|nr:COX15/CtaA family protein [Actinomycetota bacterium]
MASSARPGGVSRALVYTSIATAALTYGLVGLGSTVRVTDSGMGCPSWPLCYGQLGPIFRYHPILEESHRYLAAIVSVFVFATLLLALRSSRLPMLRRAAKIAAALVVFQVLLGGLTVLARNAPWTVALHLITGLVFLASVTVTATFAVLGDRYRGLPLASRTWGLWSLVTTVVLLFSGTLVVGAGAGAVCPTWPVCFGNGPGRLTFIAILHRVIVGAASVLIVAFVLRSWGGGSRAWRVRSVFLAAWLGVVALIGAAVAISKSIPSWADVHLAAAALLLILLVVQTFTLGAAPRTEESEMPVSQEVR